MSKNNPELGKISQVIVSVPVVNNARGADIPYLITSISSRAVGTLFRDCGVPSSIVKSVNIRLVPEPTLKDVGASFSDMKRGLHSIFVYTDPLWRIYQKAELEATKVLNGDKSSFSSGLFPPKVEQKIIACVNGKKSSFGDLEDAIGHAGDVAVNHQVARVLGREGRRYQDTVDHPFLTGTIGSLTNFGLPVLCLEIARRHPFLSGNEGQNFMFNALMMVGAFDIGRRLSAIDPFNMRAVLAGDVAFNQPKPPSVLQLRQKVKTGQV